jgi:hypothetical protein
MTDDVDRPSLSDRFPELSTLLSVYFESAVAGEEPSADAAVDAFRTEEGLHAALAAADQIETLLREAPNEGALEEAVVIRLGGQSFEGWTEGHSSWRSWLRSLRLRLARPPDSRP